MMSAGDDLPPMEGDTTRNDAPPSGAQAPKLETARVAQPGAHPIEPSQFTHESKLPPLRLEEPKARLAKGPTVIALAGVGSAIALATAFAFSPPPPPQKAAEQRPEQGAVTQAVQLPDVIQDHPTNATPDAGADATAGGPFHRNAAGDGYRPGESASVQDGSRRARREMLREEREKALGSSLYANIDDPFAGEQRPMSGLGASPQPSSELAGPPRAGAPTASASSAGDQNLQGRKNDFLTQTDRSDGYLPNQIVRPRSPYEVKAGTVIPTVLVTGINSDLPGTILGQVRENVYDTVTGNYLLIPQGSKLLATYDSMVAYGHLTAAERGIYELVARRYIAQFYQPHEFDEAKIEVLVAGELFRATGRQTIVEGWRVLAAEPPPEDPTEDPDSGAQALPSARQGESVRCGDVTIVDKRTQPPKRFTDSTLIAAMTGIARFVDDPKIRQLLRETDGIGTPATQATIIGTLFERRFIEKKGRHVVSTPVARALVHILPAIATRPDMTALWEAAMRRIAEGGMSLDVFLGGVVEQLRKLVDSGRALTALEVPGVRRCAAPGCAGRLRLRDGRSGRFWSCTRYPDCRYTEPQEPTVRRPSPGGRRRAGERSKLKELPPASGGGREERDR